MMRKFMFIGFFGLMMTLQAQTHEQAVSAFSNSYKNEQYQKYDEAIADLQKVYATTDYAVNLRLGWLHYVKGDLSGAENYYRKAIELESKSIEARKGLANVLSMMERWNDVKKVYGSILKDDPSNSEVNYYMAAIYHAEKDFNKAASYGEKVLSHYPFDYNTLVLLGQIYIGQARLKEAKEVLQRALLYSPDDATAKDLLNKI